MSASFDRSRIAACREVSFSLYLIHVPVILSLSSWLYVQGMTRYGLTDEQSAGLAVTAGLVVSLAAAWVGAVTVEPASIWVGKTLYAVVFRPARPEPTE